MSRPEESVWAYPRPPRLERDTRRLRVVFAGETIADTIRGCRVLETSHPPTFYLPAEDVRSELLELAPGRSWCEWKGRAVYWTIVAGGRRAERAAWSYPEPTADFAPIPDHLAFYPSRVGACFVDDEQVQAQAGDFYGGWVTAEIRGPLKGGPGTAGW
jgi:uncharacterized protein (DUF427 family)